jgi:hypothetical protein
MYRRSDPRWNRTIQHITENIEHANESAQENIYGFTQRYVNPCLSSITECVNVCTASCIPAHIDRRRQRGRSRARAELSFDFYDDWEEDESDGLLGWGSDNLDRFLGGTSTYGATTQPGRQRAMSYGQRSRDPRYNAPRRKSTALPRDGGQDPTIIPSSSYFGFLGRLPFRIGGKGLRYKPSAADLTEHPGASRRRLEEDQPLIEDSDEDAHQGSEHKGHRRQRSDTHTSGHTTDSLSSRGDIFPSEDELEDAVPLDDEFTISLERRTTGQWNEDSTSSNKTRSSKSKRPSGSRLSTRTVSSRNTQTSGTANSEEGILQHSTPEIIEEDSTLDDLHREEEHLRLDEEAEVQRRRQGARQLAIKRGLVPEPQLPVYASESTTPRSPSPQATSQMTAVNPAISPLVRSPVSEIAPPAAVVAFPAFASPRTTPESNMIHVADSACSSTQSTLERPLSIKDEMQRPSSDAEFVPAKLPSFGAGP